MRRRSFFHSALLAGLGIATGRTRAADQPAAAEGIDSDRIDPYYLESGDLSPAEQQSIEEFTGYEDAVAAGQDAIMPRGGRPKRAPTFRFLHWNGELGDPAAGWAGPLSLPPGMSGPGPFKLNAQILGFNVSTRDWKGASGNGTLSIELRARYLGESMTWLYLEQFEVVKGGGTSIGLTYVAQREGAPHPVISEERNVDLRIQLIRLRKAPAVLRKILSVGSFLTGLPIGGGDGGGSQSPYSFTDSKPAISVPHLAREGVAFAQATVGGMSDEAPIWRSGFTSYSLSKGGSRLALRPGFWVAVDDSQQIDFQSMSLEDAGGRVRLTQGGKPVDLNYLVLALEIEGSASDRGPLPQGVVPKGEAS